MFKKFHQRIDRLSDGPRLLLLTVMCVMVATAISPPWKDTPLALSVALFLPVMLFVATRAFHFWGPRRR